MRWRRVFSYTGIVAAAFLISIYFTVNILLKTGETVVCPDVKGKNVDDAKKLLESKGLSLAVIKYERRNDVPYNYITVQKPEANISTRKGRTVLAIVSEGPELIQIPVLTGQMVESAEATLKEINVKIEKTIYVPGQKPGKVVAQIPTGGEKIVEGKEVILFVGAAEKNLYVMPDVNALYLSELSFEMTKKGIKHKITYVRGELNIYSKATVETSIPVKTIFKADEEIKIKVTTGG